MNMWKKAAMKMIMIITGLLLAVSGVFAQERKIVDGLPFTSVEEQAVEQPVKLVAPDLVPFYIELPRTIRPSRSSTDDAKDQKTAFDEAGYIEAAPPDILVFAPWSQSKEGGHVCRVELRSADAQALRLQLKGAFGADGLELRVYDPATRSAFGPYSSPRLTEDETWWTTIIFGEAIGLEFHQPPGAEFPPHMPVITHIAYYYEGPRSGGIQPTQGCLLLEDVTCFPEFANEARAVMMLSTVDMFNNVAGYCSGALLNRKAEDHSPLVMTANHCIGGSQTQASMTAFVWFFQTPICNGTAPNPNSLPRSNGARILKRYSASDWELLGLFERPPTNTYFLGWDAGEWEDLPQPAIGISHPGGTLKRISLGEAEDTSERTFCDENEQNCFDAEVYDVTWTRGDTLRGSSGSPLMDSNRRVRGTATGVSRCQIARYGRFDLAFPTLSPYLSDIADPVFVNGAFTGEERGTVLNPFDSVYQASFAVIAGHEIWIKAGNYPERFTIWRPMTLKAVGGTVVIGK